MSPDSRGFDPHSTRNDLKKSVESGKQSVLTLCSLCLALCGIQREADLILNLNIFLKALLMIKTRTSLVDKLTEFVRSNHPYEVCEVISLPIKNGNPPYLKWIEDTLPEN